MTSFKSFGCSSLLCIVILAESAVSCQVKEAMRASQEEDARRTFGSICLSSVLEQPSETRMSLSGDDADGFSLLWDEGDAMCVIAFDGSGNTESKEFTIQSGSNTSAGEFEGALTEGFSPRYAVFPAETSPKIENGNLVAFIGNQKTARPGNITKSQNFCVSKIESSSVSPVGRPKFFMRNVMGLFRVSLTSDVEVRIKRMTLHDLGGNMLWGTCAMPLGQDGEIDYEHADFTGGDNAIYMEWDTPAVISKSAKSFYFSVPAGSLDRGFSIVLYEADDAAAGGLGRAYTFIQKTSGTVPAMRNVILALPGTGITEKSEPLDVAARGYYKSLFIDGGTDLNHYCTPDKIPAISALGLEDDYEYIRTKSLYSVQEDIMVQNDGENTSGGLGYVDSNGVLLYPDGEPRFRAIFVNGGSPQAHGERLGTKGRENIRQFYMNGGSYAGACAGAILASTEVDNVAHYGNADETENWTFGIWPAGVIHTGWPMNLSTDPENPIPLGERPSVYSAQQVCAPLVECSGGTLASELIIEDVRHHGGVYFPNLQLEIAGSGAERIADYYYSYSHEGGMEVDDMLRFNPENIGPGTYFGECGWWTSGNKCSTVAYKKDKQSGRALLSGSHFENAKSGAQLSFFKAGLKYAMAGNGSPAVKAVLIPGQRYELDKTGSDNDPAHTGIGDRQYHHFMFETDAVTPEVGITLDSGFDKSSGVDLYMGLRKGDFAWLSDADYTLTDKGGQKALNIKNLPAGIWYVSVYCATSVESDAAEDETSATAYFKYSGHTELMEGAAYSLTVDLSGASSGK